MFSLFWYILKQLFTSVSVASGGYLPRREYPPLATSTWVNNCYICTDSAYRENLNSSLKEIQNKKKNAI